MTQAGASAWLLGSVEEQGEGGSSGAGLIVTDGADDGLNSWSRASGGMLVDGDDEDGRQPGAFIYMSRTCCHVESNS